MMHRLSSSSVSAIPSLLCRPVSQLIPSSIQPSSRLPNATIYPLCHSRLSELASQNTRAIPPAISKVRSAAIDIMAAGLAARNSTVRRVSLLSFLLSNRSSAGCTTPIGAAIRAFSEGRSLYSEKLQPRSSRRNGTCDAQYVAPSFQQLSHSRYPKPIRFISSSLCKEPCLRTRSPIESPAKLQLLLMMTKTQFPVHPAFSQLSANFSSEAETKDFAREQEMLHFPSSTVRFTNELKIIPCCPTEPIPCYRLLDDYGQQIEPGDQVPEVDHALAVKMYHKMVALQTMDHFFYEVQRQGRISFYMTTIGEEAINIASPAALSDQDVVFTQYREPGILMWRGFTLEDFANQCFGNEGDGCKGRQMPVHYGSRALNFFTVSSPIATQLPHAVGAAYSLKMDKEPLCSVVYFGEGASSEGDFHAAMNFAAVYEVPVIFLCRNNGWAISTPASEQLRGDGVVAKGQAYGMHSIRVDGNDALAVFSAVKAARKLAVEESKPVLIEALTYRIGHHSTSDDSLRYRSADEVDHWKVVRDPVLRFRRWIQGNGWWSAEAEMKLRAETRKEMLAGVENAERRKKRGVGEMFTDVYDRMAGNLQEQERYVRETVKKHKEDYPSLVPSV